MRSRFVKAGIVALSIAACARGSLAAQSTPDCTVAACVYLPLAHVELRPTASAPTATSTALPTMTPVATPDDPLNTHGQDIYNCTDFSTWAQANAVYQANLPGDPNRLDSDSDGIPCESLPGAP